MKKKQDLIFYLSFSIAWVVGKPTVIKTLQHTYPIQSTCHQYVCLTSSRKNFSFGLYSPLPALVTEYSASSEIYFLNHMWQSIFVLYPIHIAKMRFTLTVCHYIHDLTRFDDKTCATIRKLQTHRFPPIPLQLLQVRIYIYGPQRVSLDEVCLLQHSLKPCFTGYPLISFHCWQSSAQYYTILRRAQCFVEAFVQCSPWVQNIYFKISILSSRQITWSQWTWVSSDIPKSFGRSRLADP